MAPVLIRKSGAPITAGQQAAMYYARKRRNTRAEASENHSLLTRYKTHLGFLIKVVLSTT